MPNLSIITKFCPNDQDETFVGVLVSFRLALALVKFGPKINRNEKEENGSNATRHIAQMAVLHLQL